MQMCIVVDGDDIVMKYPIRILQVFSRMDRGGSETVIMNYYRNIDRKKVQFDFVVHTDEKCAFDDEIETLGGRIYRMPRYNVINHLKYVRMWKKFFLAHPEYKIIHGHYFTISVIYLGVAQKYDLVCIAHTHSAYSGKGLNALLMKLITLPIRYIADYLFACSKLAGIWLYGHRAIENRNFYILNNAIDAKQFIFNSEIRVKVRDDFEISDKFVIGHVGRFNTPKNHEFLIDIFKELYNRNNDSVLLLVGDGELRPTIAKKVTDLGLTDSVIFAGVRSDIPELLQAMDVFVFPSLYEGLPVTLVEAQAAGLPCVLSDVISKETFITDLIESVSLKQSIEVWADKILKYVDGYERRCKYNDIKNSGYDVKNTAKWLEKFYLERG